MDYLAWTKTKKRVSFDYFETSKDCLENLNIYYFKNPEIVKYDSGFFGIRVTNNQYKEWFFDCELKNLTETKKTDFFILLE